MEKLKEMWMNFLREERNTDDWWVRKKALWRERESEIVRIQGDAKIYRKIRYENEAEYAYLLHVAYFIKQGDHFHREEQVTPYRFRLLDGEITDHKEIVPAKQPTAKQSITPDEIQERSAHMRFSYDRLAAVQYAERWWNSYNPNYRKFDVDCTNYVSQCLRAGGAPMRGAPVREQGWWYQDDNWSFSWAVAHSMRWYLSGSEEGLQGKEVENAEALLPGDIICYDFEGDGRFDHNTIVVAKDSYGMPLVNAHTDNSRNRYWSYEDSTAWTPNIQYKFFQIGE
ncbi:amidase domain-containing protein [Virgibacillus salidurans]|uniref:amidase domain-containing protein n=1 Tax=Virgibacillus salidurans TaxID=2831673 RepID=UPI001F29D515|nr:amidase domain-containing protein [Virgibacillus sp. NKC19-16]